MDHFELGVACIGLAIMNSKGAIDLSGLQERTEVLSLTDSCIRILALVLTSY